jgi:hypothetical protein
VLLLAFFQLACCAEGVQLNRGYIADEDTAIYNPGLSLLTESEKERLVEAVISSRKAGLAAESWTNDNQSRLRISQGEA